MWNILINAPMSPPNQEISSTASFLILSTKQFSQAMLRTSIYVKKSDLTLLARPMHLLAFIENNTVANWKWNYSQVQYRVII